MIERGGGHRLASQTLARVWFSSGFGREQLDGDLTIEARVAGAIDLAHPAFAKLGDDFIGSECRPYVHRITLAMTSSRRRSREYPASGGGPPAPSAATISYEPRREPGESVRNAK